MANIASARRGLSLWGWLRRITVLPSARGRSVALAGVAIVACCLAGAAGVQMYLDHLRNAQLGVAYDRQRAADIAAYADATLSRYQAVGRLYANGGLADEAVAALPGVRGIAVSDPSGQSLRAGGAFLDMSALAAMMRHKREIFSSGDHALIVFRDVDRLIAVAFDSAGIVPSGMLSDAVLLSPAETVLGGRLADGPAVTAAARTWPLRVRTGVRNAAALSPRPGASALYFFLICGPLLAGLWLAGLFLQELEWRAKAARVVRALRLTYPREAKLRMRLAASERERVEVMRERSALFAEICGRMCTPLNAVVGFAELIERKVCGPLGHARYAEYAGNIRDAGRGLHTQLAEVCELAEIEAGRRPLHWTVCDVAELVSDCIAENAGRAFLRRIWLEMVPAGAAPARVDPEAVRRILTVMVQDALHRTPEGGKVRLRVEPRPEGVCVVVEDSDRIRAAGPDGRRDPQSRLALVAAQELARLMGGRLRSVDVAGRGRRFRLDLPSAVGLGTDRIAQMPA